MKRSNPENNNRGGGGSGGGKRYRNSEGGYAEALAEGKFELRLLIPTKAAGAVIGKGGEYIKAVRDKFDAQLSVPDRSTPERVLTILCRQEVVADCFNEVLHKLAEEAKRSDLEIRVLVHQSHAGAIIGRGGGKIKELREQTQTQIKVFQDCAPNSTDRIVSISAPQEKLPGAVGALCDFMKDVPIKGSMKPYDATNYDPRLAPGYGGYSSDSKYHSGGSMDRGGSGRGGGGGPQYQPAPYDYNRGPPGGYGGGGHGGGYGGRQGGGPMGPMPGGYGGMPDAGVTTTQVTIPNELGGTIIGKGGERINRIRQESGARIDVGSAYGNEERIITISGTPHQIQSAQYLLQQSVRTSEAGRRYLHEKH